MRWLVEGHMVNITPVSPGLMLGWREVQVWLRCRPFLKLMGDHEIQNNIHSLEFFVQILNNLMVVLSMPLPLVYILKWTQMCRVRDERALVR